MDVSPSVGTLNRPGACVSISRHPTLTFVSEHAYKRNPPKPTHAHPRPPTPIHPPTHTHLQAIGGPQTRGGPRLIDGGADTPPQRRSRRASRVPVASASNVAVGEIVVERMSASSQNEAVGQNLDALLAMGYTDQSAVAALAHTGGFLEPAIELLSADPEFGKRP